MRQYLTGSTLFASVQMLRNGTGQSVLVVEGDTDSLTLSPHVDRKLARIIVGNGRNSVIEVIQLVDKTGLSKVVGLVDSDIYRHVGKKESTASPNLIKTENYDLESDVLYTEDILDRIIYSQVSADDVSAFLERHQYGSTMDLITHLAGAIAQVRIDSIRQGNELNLREVPLTAFIQSDLPGFDTASMAAAIRARSTRPKLDKRAITSRLNRALRIRVMDKSICCGHDLVSVISGAITRWWGVKITVDGIARLLRGALSTQNLEKMHVYSELLSWSERNDSPIWMRK